VVGSAGLLAGGRSVPRELIAVAAERGLDLSAHQSRDLTEVDLPSVDLVIAMERRHVREVVLRDPTSYPRTFTLKELVRRSREIPLEKRGKLPARTLALAHVGRKRTDMLGSSSSDDVADPYGGSVDDYRRAVAELSELVEALVLQLWPTT